jgi:tetratricopeptide (TPR) repeat protein
VDGDTMAGVVPQFVNAETVADTREAMTPKPLDTPRNVRRWPWLLGAAAVIAAAVVLATGRNPQSPRETVVQQAVASPLMDLNALDLLYVQAGEPVPPEACQCREPAVLARLTTAARALQQSVAGVSGPEITQAVAALQEAPGQPCAELDTWRARADLQAGRSVQAVTAAQRAVSACPKLAVAHHLAGKAYLVQGQTVEAEAAFHKAMEIAPDFTAPAFNLGLLAVARKDGAAAVALFEPLTRKEAERGDVWFDLGLQDAARLCIAP